MTSQLTRTSGVLHVSRSELNLKACLKGGMSFRWTLTQEDDSQARFVGVLNKKICVLNQNYILDKIDYSVYNSHSQTDEMLVRKELIDYFRLDKDLTQLYKDWSSRDPKFKEKISAYPLILNGIRVLRQEPVENLFCFICSSNNNIKRITQMVANMCRQFGESIGILDSIEHFSFPTIERLAQEDVEAKLKALSFGYRAKFINKAAVYLKQTHSADWLYSLRQRSYEEACQELIKIHGVGKKVYLSHCE